MVARKEIGKDIANSQNVMLFSYFLKTQTWNPGIDLQNKES